MRLKKVLACVLSAAMIATGMSFGGLGTGTVQAATGVGDSVTVPERVLAEIDSGVLAENAKANSEQLPAAGNDGGASWAFDDEGHWWHSRYQGQIGAGEVENGLVSSNKPIWIQTGFGTAKKIKKLTYLSRDNGMGSINAYKVQYANVEGVPQDSDFQDVPGAAGNLQNIRTEQEIVFAEAVTATHIRLVATSIYANGGQQYVAAKRIRVFEETEGTTSVTYDFYKQSDFWDYEVAHGNLADQTEDADRWHYQIQTPSAGWIDIPAAALKTKENGEKSWMNDDRAQDSTYHYAKLNKDEITSTFLSETTHTAVAYAWKAPESGYFKMTLESPISQASNPGPSFFVCYSAGQQADKELFREDAGAGAMITSKIAKVEKDGWLRLGATTKNAWATGVKPKVEKVTVKDYARQYLAEVANVENQDTYTEASKQAVKDARTALTEAVQAAEPSMALIEERLTALETAIADLELYVAVTGITLNKETLSLEIGATETLTATVTPDNATDKEVIWSSDQADVAAVDENTGEVTANKVGTAKITVYSTKYPEIKAECTVVVTRDDTALDAAIAAAKAKMADENYAEQYTEASKAALAEALALAEAAKEDLQMSPEEVKQVVENLQAAISGLELKAVVTIEINGQTETKYCEVGEQVKVTAAAAPEGKKFSHWTFAGKPICYKDSYTFTVYGDTTVTAVYIDAAADVEKAVNVLCSVSYQDGKVKFLSKHSVPADAGYTVLRAGVVATDSTGYAAIEKAGEQLTLDTIATARLKKYGVNTSYYLANFTQYLKTSRATTWYARGYVTYRDAKGIEHTEYSAVATYTVK